MAPTNRYFIGPLTAAQQRRRQRNQRRFDRLLDIKYTFNVTMREAMQKDTDDRKYGYGRQYRLSDYLNT